MRVIAGKARSVPLKAPLGDKTRPTTDRIKETLFNIISDEIYGCAFLDLFAGSGQMGIEALSRGAKSAVFAESDKKVCEIIKENLAKTKLLDDAKVIRTNINASLDPLLSYGPYDIIFMDPPYDFGAEESVLKSILETHLLAEDGIIIIEADLKRNLDMDGLTLTVFREKIYKTNKHIFIKEND